MTKADLEKVAVTIEYVYGDRVDGAEAKALLDSILGLVRAMVPPQE